MSLALLGKLCVREQCLSFVCFKCGHERLALSWKTGSSSGRLRLAKVVCALLEYAVLDQPAGRFQEEEDEIEVWLGSFDHV
jgi:hypothetical protein